MSNADCKFENGKGVCRCKPGYGISSKQTCSHDGSNDIEIENVQPVAIKENLIVPERTPANFASPGSYKPLTFQNVPTLAPNKNYDENDRPKFSYSNRSILQFFQRLMRVLNSDNVTI